MKKATKTIYFLIICLLLICAAIVFRNTHTDYIDKLIREYQPAGASITIIENGKITQTRNYGYANIEDKQTVTDKTKFKIASISKTVTAYAVMQLVEQGKLDLDVPVNTYLKKWKIPESEYNEDKVTLRTLMSHTAGVTGSNEYGYETPLPSIDEALADRQISLKREPGTEFEYSEFSGFGICQLVIEDVTGQKFEDYMEDNVFHALKMTSTDYANESNDNGFLATPYAGKDKPVEVTKIVMNGAGGVATTSADLAKFGIALMDYYETGNMEMFTPQENTESIGGVYGLGIIPRTMTDGTVVYEHNGTLTGWNAQLVIEPKSRNGIVIVTNSDKAFYLTYALMEEWSKNVLGEAVTDSQITSIQNVITFISIMLFLVLVILLLVLGRKIKKEKLIWNPDKNIFKICMITFLTLGLGIIYYLTLYSDKVFQLLFGMNNYFLYTFFPPSFKWINIQLILIGSTLIGRILLYKKAKK